MPRYSPTLPAKIPRTPGFSSPARHFWLKKVRVRNPRPSVIDTSRIDPRFCRIGRSVTLRTSATMVTLSSTVSSVNEVSSPRFAYRRG